MHEATEIWLVAREKAALHQAIARYAQDERYMIRSC